MIDSYDLILAQNVTRSKKSYEIVKIHYEQ